MSIKMEGKRIIRLNTHGDLIDQINYHGFNLLKRDDGYRRINFQAGDYISPYLDVINTKSIFYVFYEKDDFKDIDKDVLNEKLNDFGIKILGEENFIVDGAYIAKDLVFFGKVRYSHEYVVKTVMASDRRVKKPDMDLQDLLAHAAYLQNANSDKTYEGRVIPVVCNLEFRLFPSLKVAQSVVNGSLKEVSLGSELFFVEDVVDCDCNVENKILC